MKSSLNLGCGPDIRPGWINVDAYYKHPLVTTMDFTQTPWKFKDETFDLVYASHVLEHIPVRFHHTDNRDVFWHILEEIHRVLAPGGILHLRVPYSKDVEAAWSNPTHYRAWSIGTFSYLNGRAREASYYTKAKFNATWQFNKIGPKGYGFMLRGLPLSSHAWQRLPWLRWAIPGVREIEAWLVKA